MAHLIDTPCTNIVLVHYHVGIKPLLPLFPARSIYSLLTYFLRIGSQSSLSPPAELLRSLPHPILSTTATKKLSK